MIKTYKTHTLGCKVNQYETEAVEELLNESGLFKKAGKKEQADIYIINTCTVTNAADSKSRQFISKSKKENPDATVAVMGCYVQVSPEAVAALNGVDIMIGNKDKNKIVEQLKKWRENELINLVEDISKYKKYDELEIKDTKERTRAYMKIQDGCNKFCTFCKIPFARGPIRSRQMQSIINEANELAEKGFKEVVLTGIHVASFGNDLDDGSLVSVIEDIAKNEKISRIRTSSMDPSFITRERIKALYETNKLCDHFHLSLQSGSNNVLKLMNRRYTREEYLEKVEIIREFYPDAGITTDIIVGFPGETEEDFIDSLNIVKEARLSKVHIFPYSIRTGTPAAHMEGQLDKKTKDERSKKLKEVADIVANDEAEKYIGKELDVLFEGHSKKQGSTYGYSTNYFRVEIKGIKMLENEIVKVKIIDRKDSLLVGELV